MEDEHHQVGGLGYRIETWKPALNLFFSLTTNTNCLQENLIIFHVFPHCHRMVTHVCPLFFPPFSSYASRFISSYPSDSSNKKNIAVGVFFHKKDTGSTKDVLAVITQWSKATVSQALMGPEDNKPSRDTSVFLLNGCEYAPKHI